jgi:hypothetical protein
VGGYFDAAKGQILAERFLVTAHARPAGKIGIAKAFLLKIVRPNFIVRKIGDEALVNAVVVGNLTVFKWDTEF